MTIATIARILAYTMTNQTARPFVAQLARTEAQEYANTYPNDDRPAIAARDLFMGLQFSADPDTLTDADRQPFIVAFVAAYRTIRGIDEL